MTLETLMKSIYVALLLGLCQSVKGPSPEPMRTLLTLFILLAASVVALAQTFDAEKSLKELNEWYTQQARSRGNEKSFIPIGDVLRRLQQDRQQRALLLIGTVPPQEIPPKQALAAAELYCHADLASNKVVAAKRFLTTQPEPALRYQAHQLLLQGYEKLSDAAGLQSVLRETKPPSAHDALVLMNQAASIHTKIIAAEFGTKAALETLSQVESLASLDALVEDQKEGGLAENVVAKLAATRASLLSSLGRTENAHRVLLEARSKIRRPLAISILDRAAEKLGPVAPPKK
jgi:hypothetical protein